MRIDAHQHYWKLGRGDYRWLTPELPVLYRDYVPGDLAGSLEKHRMDGSIVVQAAQTIGETEYLLSLAEETPSILGVVGWLDLFDTEHRLHFNTLRRHPKFVGFRIMIQELPDAGRILEPCFVEALRGYAADGVPVDLLLRSDQLEPVVRLLHRVPDLRGVIDHIAKPRIGQGETEPWLSRMKELAGFPNLSCKLSGMVTEADHRAWKPDDFTSYIRHALDMFGPNRVLFGSDWPVCLLAAGYDEVVDILERAIPDGWSEGDRERLFGLNAMGIYNLNHGGIVHETEG